MSKQTLYIVQGDLAFWAYSVYGSYTSKEKAKRRIDELVKALDRDQRHELNVKLEDIEAAKDYRSLLIHEVEVDQPTDTVDW